MPKHTEYAIAWDLPSQQYHLRDPEHAKTLAAIFGDPLSFLPDSEEWFTWLAARSSFAFLGKSGRFTARRETKQRGDAYWIAYQRVAGKLRKKYLGKTCELTSTLLEDVARFFADSAPSPCHERPACPALEPLPVPPIAPQAWAMISAEAMAIDIGKDPQGPPYDDAPWLLDRSHFPLVTPTTERCPFHPTACWLRRDPIGQAWCSSPTCWRRYNLMRLGDLVNYQRLLGYGWDTRIEPGIPSWSTYTLTKDDERIAFSIRQATIFCNSLGLTLPDLSEQARLSNPPLYDAWK